MYELKEQFFSPSKWIEHIALSEVDKFGNQIIAVSYSWMSKGLLKRKTCYFYEKETKCSSLVNAKSVGHTYWYWWSVYGTPANRFIPSNSEDGGQDGEPIEKKAYLTSEDLEELNSVEDRPDALKEKLNEIVERSGFSLETIRDLYDRFNLGFDFIDHVNKIRRMIELEQLTGMKAVSKFMLEIQRFFGINFKKKFFYETLNRVGVGKVNPYQWYTKIKYHYKNIAQVLDAEGFDGAVKMVERMFMTKNPLIKDKRVYGAIKGIKQIKGARRLGKIYEGEEAVEEIGKFANKYLKELQRGFLKRNSRNLEKVLNKEGEVIGVRWVRTRELGFGGKLWRASKGIVRLGRGALDFLLLFLPSGKK